MGVIPKLINDLAADVVYTGVVQHKVGPSGYWRDPYNLDHYEKGCLMLPELDNIRNYDEQRKTNFCSVDKIVCFADPSDGVIQPWQSGWFGVWKTGQDTEAMPMEEREEYQKDLFGLKTMNEAGRIVLKKSGLQHGGYLKTEAFIMKKVIKFLMMKAK